MFLEKIERGAYSVLTVRQNRGYETPRGLLQLLCLGPPTNLLVKSLQLNTDQQLTRTTN